MRHFQHVAGFPSNETIMHSSNAKDIENIPITRRDVILTKEMLGSRKYAMKGNTTRYRPCLVGFTFQKLDVPNYIMKFYKVLEL